MTHDSVAFIGTFDPFHGAHIGQLLRAYTYMPFTEVKVILVKHQSHKPNATPWEHRLAIGRLTLEAANLPFDCRLIPVEDAEAAESIAGIDRKITGVDSLIDDLQNPVRRQRAYRWPMIVLSIPGVRRSLLTEALNGLSDGERAKINYEYVSVSAAPMMNWDFEAQQFASERVHSAYVRAGRSKAFLPTTAREYIMKHGLYNNESMAK